MTAAAIVVRADEPLEVLIALFRPYVQLGLTLNQGNAMPVPTFEFCEIRA